MLGSIGSLFKGMLYGAGLMYFLDPDRGRRRRAGAIDRAVHLAREAEHLWDQGCRDLKNRGRGLAAEARKSVTLEPVSDQQLAERVRAALGHQIDRSRRVDVSSENGVVTLRGTVRPGEPQRLIPAIESLAGVRAVESSLATEGEPVPLRLDRQRLTPASRLLLTTGGGLLVLNGLMRRGFVPSFFGVAGVGMLARSLADRPGGLTGLGREQGTTLHASIGIRAPVEKVFDFVSDLDQSGPLLSDAIQIESLGGGRLRWTIEGPAGVGRIAGEGLLLESVANEQIVWASNHDSPVRFLKELRFLPEGESTRLDVQAVFELPGGLIGQAAAALVKIDSQARLHRSLNRMKHHLESNTVSRGAASESVREHRG